MHPASALALPTLNETVKTAVSPHKITLPERILWGTGAHTFHSTANAPTARGTCPLYGKPGSFESPYVSSITETMTDQSDLCFSFPPLPLLHSFYHRRTSLFTILRSQILSPLFYLLLTHFPNHPPRSNPFPNLSRPLPPHTASQRESSQARERWASPFACFVRL